MRSEAADIDEAEVGVEKRLVGSEAADAVSPAIIRGTKSAKMEVGKKAFMMIAWEVDRRSEVCQRLQIRKIVQRSW